LEVDAMDADSALVPRAELLKQFRISDSSEWRQRNGTADWPPHVVIGKKIYYRKSQIDAWLRRQEAESVVPYGEAGS
jgi:hypothetical protein